MNPLRSRGMTLALTLLVSACGRGRREVPSNDGDFVVTGGYRLHYRVVGDGPDTVVVLHGGPGLHFGYLEEGLRPLARGRTLIFYDQRGRGRSSPIDSLALSLDGDLTDLDAVRHRFALGRMTLVGHHWGAAVVGLYATRHPDRVARLLLISPFPVHPGFVYEFAMLGWPGIDRAKVIQAHHAVGSSAAARTFCEAHPWWYFLPTPPDSAELPQSIRAAVCDTAMNNLSNAETVQRVMYRSLGDWSWRVALNAVTAPALIVEGKGPPQVRSAAERWAQHLANGRLLLLAGPHLFPWIDDATAFTNTADAFLRGKWPAHSERPSPFQVDTITQVSGMHASPGH